MHRGEDQPKVARDEAERRLDELERRREDKLRAFEGLGVVRRGPVSYIGSALVRPVVGEDVHITDALPCLIFRSSLNPRRRKSSSPKRTPAAPHT